MLDAGCSVEIVATVGWFEWDLTTLGGIAAAARSPHNQGSYIISLAVGLFTASIENRRFKRLTASGESYAWTSDGNL